MKKIISILLLLSMFLATLSGCGIKPGALSSISDNTVTENLAVSGASGTLKENAALAEAFYAGDTTNGYTHSEAWDGSTDETWVSSTAAAADGKKYYTITTASELAGMLTQQQAGETFEDWVITLGANIDLGERQWTGANVASNKYFMGEFDGQNHVIANYKMEITASCARGFFGSYSGSATLKNVALVEGNYIDSEGSTNDSNAGNKDYFGFAVCKAVTTADNAIIVDNVYCSSVLTQGEGRNEAYAISRIGLVAYTEGAGTLNINNCEYAGDIDATGDYVAGILGYVKSGAVNVTNCVNRADISGRSYVGGIVGYITPGSNTVQNCTNTGNVSVVNHSANAIVGYHVPSGTVVTGCQNSGTVTEPNGAYGTSFLSAINTAITTFTGTSSEGWDGEQATLSNWYDSTDETGWFLSADKKDSGGAYLIANADDLRAFVYAVAQGNNFSGKTVKLTADINLNGKEWAPIVATDTEKLFKGTLNGQNHVIGNFVMTISPASVSNLTSNAQGLLGSLGGGAVVKNLAVVNGTYNVTTATNSVGTIFAVADLYNGAIKLTNLYSNCVISNKTTGITAEGGIVGQIKASNTTSATMYIQNCTFAGSVSASDAANVASYVGGIVGKIGTGVNLQVLDCLNTANISGDDVIGGIVGGTADGFVSKTLHIIDCKNTGSISGASGVGGIFGSSTPSGELTVTPTTVSTGNFRIRNCVNNGSVTGTADCVGGIAGIIWVDGKKTIINGCKVEPAVGSTLTIQAGKRPAGGIIGATQGNSRSSFDIFDCHATNITIENTAAAGQIGGIVGRSYSQGTLSIMYCSSTDCVFSSNSFHVGGMVGYVDRCKKLQIDDCNFTANSEITFSRENSGGIIGYLDSKSAEVNISNCEIVGPLRFSSSYSGGIIGKVNAVNQLKLQNCKVGTDTSPCTITATGKTNVGGIVGNILVGKFVIDNCDFTGTLTAGGSSAGIVGKIGESNTAAKAVSGVISNCDVKATLTLGGVQSGGIVGFACLQTDESEKLLVKDCSVDGTIAAASQNMIGGAVGYIKHTWVEIDGFTFTGSMTAGRSAGGVVGSNTAASSSSATNYSAKRTPQLILKNCDVSANLTFNLASSTNSGVGGLIGYVSISTTVEDSVYSGEINATLALPDAAAPKAYVGGLIGFSSTALVIKNSSMKGQIKKVDMTSASTLAYTGYVSGIAYGPSDARYIDVGLRSDVFGTLSTDSRLQVSREVFKSGTASTMAPVRVVGYQTSAKYGETGSEKYDLRYIAAVDQLPTKAWAGFKVTIQYYANGELKTFNSVAYASTVYTTIKGNSTTYSADQFNCEYLYALIVTGVPAEYVEGGMNQLAVSIVPFVVDLGEDGTNKTNAATYGMTSVHGSVSATATETVPTPINDPVKYNVSENGNYYSWRVDGEKAGATYTDYITKFTGWTAESWTQTVSDTVTNQFHIYTKGDTMVYVYYCPGSQTFRAIVAHISEYQAYKNAQNKATDTATGAWEFGVVNIGHDGNHQGMALIIQLANGHFIVVDGSQHADTEGDTTDNVKRIYDWLNARANGDIVIDAWIFTHIHQDHTAAAVEFERQYGHIVTINRYMYNFPAGEAAWSLAAVPDLSVSNYIGYFADVEEIASRYERVTLQTGMRFNISNATIEVLFTHEDLKSNELIGFNNSSTVFKITMHTDANTSKSFLVTGDSMEVPASTTGITGTAVYKTLILQAGSMLTSDYVQMAHHGSNGLNGTGNATYDFYQIATGNYAGAILVPANQELQKLVDASTKFATVANNAAAGGGFYYAFHNSYTVRSDGYVYINRDFDNSISENKPTTEDLTVPEATNSTT